MEQREHRDGANATQGPNPLDAGHIEGQNPDTPQRLPGHTRFLRDRVRTPAATSNALMMAVALAALAALILMLAAAG